MCGLCYTYNDPEGEFDRLLEAAGAEDENAFTSQDYTAYVQNLPAKDDQNLNLIASLESDRMVNLDLNPKYFGTEREVVQNERRFRTENSPEGLMYQALFEKAFKVHPYHWPVIGYSADLERMTVKDPIAFYKAHYNPEHATVIVAGDVDTSDVLDVIRKYYGKIQSPVTEPHPIPAEPPQTSPRRERLKLNIPVEKMLLGYHIPGIKSEDIPALEVVQAVLAGGKSSRLHRALVDTGIATSVDTDDIESKDPGLFIISVDLQKGKRAAQAEAIVLREMSRLMKSPASDQELARARNYINFDFYEGFSSNSRRAGFLGRFEATAGDFEVGLEQHRKVQVVAAADVQRVAKQYLEPTNRTVITGAPK